MLSRGAWNDFVGDAPGASLEILHLFWLEPNQLTQGAKEVLQGA